MTIIYAIMFIPFLLELLILIQLVRYIKFINISLADFVYYYKDSYYDKRSENYIPSRLDDIDNQLHNIFIEIKDKI